MALAGPFFNLIVTYACLLLASIYHVPLYDWLVQFLTTGQPIIGDPLKLFIFFSFYANWILAAFNLLVPAFPLDGGRIFRALLCLKFKYLKATEIAKNVSLIIALFMFFIGVFTVDLWLIIIALFVSFAAIGEYDVTVQYKLLSMIKTEELISKNYSLIKPQEKISTIAKKMVDNISPCAVLKTKQGISLIDVSKFSTISQEEKDKLTAKDVAKPIKPVSIKTNIENVIKLMNEHGISMMPVVMKGRFAGVIYKSDIEKMLHIKKHIDKVNL